MEHEQVPNRRRRREEEEKEKEEEGISRRSLERRRSRKTINFYFTW